MGGRAGFTVPSIPSFSFPILHLYGIFNPAMSRSSAATALRESFGDRIPDISRKITACVSCRKLKVPGNMLSSTAKHCLH